MQAAAEAPLEQEWDATRFEPVRSSFCESLVRLYSSSSDSLSVVTVTRSDLLAIWGLPNNPERFSVTSFWHLQSRFASAQENISSAGKAEFLIWPKGVNFCGVIFCVFFFLRELIFADRGQSAKFTKSRTHKISCCTVFDNALSTLLNCCPQHFFSCPRSRFFYASTSGGHAQWQRQ